jgi:hypothetical protein
MPEPEAPIHSSGSSGSGKDFIWKKLGPLPVVAWVAIGAGLSLLLYRRKPKATTGQTVGPLFGPSTQQGPAGPQGPPGTVKTPEPQDISGLLQSIDVLNKQLAAQQGRLPSGRFLSFGDWLALAYTGQRPDLMAAINQGRWSDLSGQYAKEVGATVTPSPSVPMWQSPAKLGT